MALKYFPVSNPSDQQTYLTDIYPYEIHCRLKIQVSLKSITLLEITLLQDADIMKYKEQIIFCMHLSMSTVN
jgi:hypothetical protein